MSAGSSRETRSNSKAVGEGQAPARRYHSVRAQSEALARPLAVEDYVVQSMPDVSPTKWHLAHTTWFFETFVLARFAPSYEPLEPRYGYLFNSYYESVGARHPRPERGMLSRPTVAETYDYRAHVDRAMGALFGRAGSAVLEEAASLIELGLQHEEQHQELMLTDLKHVLGRNPLRPAYGSAAPMPPEHEVQALRFFDQPGGLISIGHEGPEFAFDNETPRHRVFLRPYRLADRLVTNGEFLAFIEAGGYSRPEFWLSDGWATLQAHGWQAPLYWERADSGWFEYTLAGGAPLMHSAPVSHVSYYEADAYSRFAGARLPTETEWEAVAARQPTSGNFVERRHYHPSAAPDDDGVRQLYGDAWEWTGSAYLAYPGYRPWAGAVGEYNGKFMSNQFVLRGGSCATPERHVRATYRNFFPPDARWQFTGIRLAEDA